MQEVGVIICTLPENDGFKNLFICIDYFEIVADKSHQR